MKLIITLLCRALGAQHLTKIVALRAARPLPVGCPCASPRARRELAPLGWRRLEFLPLVLRLASVSLALGELPAGAAGGSTPAFLVFLAQATPFAPIEQFLLLLGMFCLIIGVILLAYGGYQISQGRVTDGLLSVLGGFILAIAVPLMKWLHGIW
jgi:hypothetical protein